jgi:ABC-2 type transport system permease protein
MNKILLVIQREYLVRVKKKSFLYTTILVPLVIVGFYAAIFAIGVSGTHEKNKVAVIDQAGLFVPPVENSKGDESTYEIITGQSLETLKGTYKNKGYDYLLYIPPMDVTKDINDIQLFSRSPLQVNQKRKIERTIDNAIELKRLQSANIPREQYRSIKSNISIENKVLNGKEEKKNVAIVAQTVSFACGMLIYVIMLIYGTMVMRGVMEEKISRIAEVMVSSVKPFQLMMGKIIGIGAVGLTQFAIWIALIAILRYVLHIPGLDNTMQQPGMAESGGMMANIGSSLGNLPWGLIISCFIFYFFGGYLLYASLFAAIGSVVSEDQSEAQQFVFPVMMPIILGFVIMTKAMSEPNSPLVVFGSLFPLTSPVVMMGRIMYNVPVSQIIASMLLLVLGILFFTWLTAKIYRTGILMYGKKVTWKEMVKWAFRKS